MSLSVDRRIGFVLSLVLAVPPVVRAGALNVINSGTAAWAQSAQSGRADMLILGDSLTWYNGHGWDHGIARAAQATFGLAGTGLIADGDTTGQGYGSHSVGGVYSGTAWPTSLEAVPADRRGYVLRAGGTPPTAGAAPRAGFGVALLQGVHDTSAAYDWSVYTASPAGGGTMGAFRKLEAGAYDTLQTLPTIATATPPGGLQKTTFTFAATPGTTATQSFRLRETTNTSVLYSRVTRPGATGVTVSSLGLGNRPTKDFYNDVLATMSPAGRSAYLSALVDGGSGKLNIMLAEGFNDRNDATPSLHNAGAGQSVAGFRDNVESTIALLRNDWAAAGFAASDLSFTLVNMYEDYWKGVYGDGNDPYGLVEHSLAAADSQISFVNLLNGPTYYQAEALGYLSDGTHPTQAGVEAYSNIIMSAIGGPPGAIIPEPAAMGAVGAVLLAGLRRVRRAV